MRVLLSCGLKTQNIVTGISKAFQGSGVDFIVVQFLDDVESIFGRGDYFDKAIISEQSITREGEITDEFELRQRVNDFAISMRERDSKFNFVFLASKEDLANMIFEEILQISKLSTVVLVPPPYNVKFFKRLIVSDINQLPEDWVYVAELDMPEEDINTTEGIGEDDPFEDMDPEEGEELKIEPAPDFDKEIFDQDGLGFDTRISDEVPVGITEELELPEEDDPFETTGESFEGEPEGSFDGDLNSGGFDGDLEGSGFDDDLNGGSFDGDLEGGFNDTNSNLENNNEFIPDDVGSTFSGDEVIDDEFGTPIDQSGDLPNYTEPVQDTYTQPEENQMFNDYSQNGTDTEEIAGFDYDDKQDTMDKDPYIPDEIDYTTPNDMYNDYDNNNQDNNLYPNTQFNDGFDKEPGVPNFDVEDYVNNNDQDQDYQNNIANKVNEEMEQAGFSPDDYEDEQQSNGQMLNPARGQQAEQERPQGKKKGGLLGKIKGKVPVPSVNSNTPRQEKQQPQKVEDKAIFDAKAGKVNANRVKESLRPFASRGNSIAVTGCGGCGTSIVAYNLANIVSQLGYTVLLVDMDTEGRAQSYLSKDNYESMEPDGANLMSAVNGSNGINTHIAVVKQGFHLLTMGLGTDAVPVNELLHKEKISRFVNLGKTSHDFVIYDIPFASAIGYLSDITYMVDNLVLVTDASNWGITKTMLSVCNIDSEDMQDTIFGRAQLVFNRYRNLYRVLGKKVKTCNDIKKVMDQKVLELIGEDPGFHFEDLHIAGIINDDPDFENGWFESVQYSDTKKGQDTFLELIENIVLKK